VGNKRAKEFKWKTKEFKSFTISEFDFNFGLTKTKTPKKAKSEVSKCLECRIVVPEGDDWLERGAGLVILIVLWRARREER